MTTDTPTLFDAPPTRGASRATDPATSRDAARSLSGPVLRDQQALVLRSVDWLIEASAWEIHCHLGYRVQQNVVAKRLGELVDLGMVRFTGKTRPGSSHRLQRVYALTDAGRAAA